MSPWNIESVLSLSRAFIESRLLLTAAELDIFTLLEHSKTLDEVVSALNSDSRGTEILLDALAGLGLLEKRDGGYCAPDEVLSLLSRESPESVLPMLLHSASMWERWSDLTAIVSKGKEAAPPPGVFEDKELSAFIYAMHAIGRHGADAIAACVNAGASRALLDVGGATGTYAEAFLRRYPGMHATVFDREPVIAMAEARLSSSDVRHRITLAAGDYNTDVLPGGHDLVLLSAIIHQNSPEQNRALYKKCYDALVSGGRILIRDHVMSPDRTRPASGAVFAVNMLVATEGGNCYTLDEIRSDLEGAGFSRVALVHDGDRMDGIVESCKA